MDRYRITFRTWNKVATVYQDRFMELDLYNDTYDTFCRLIEKPNPRIFEIGCGPGNITRYLLSSRPDFEIEAIDIAPNMVRLAEANNRAASFKVMDCRDIHTLAPGFDGIMCGFCLPYLSEADCGKLLKDCACLLNSGGVIYLSTIEGNYSQSGFETNSKGQGRMFVYYHEEAYIREQLEANDFDLVALIRKDFLQSDGTASTHLIFIARRK